MSALGVGLLLFSLQLPAFQERAVLVWADQRVEGPIPLAAASEERYRGFEYAWVWSPGAAPKRHAARELAELRVRPTRQRLTVRLERRRGESVPQARVVAAPVEMWGEVPEPLLPSWPLPTDGMLRIPAEPGRAWRVRLVGASVGSWWVSPSPGQRSLRLHALPAEARRVRVVGDGGGLAGAGVTVLSAPAGGRGRQEVLAQLRASGQGEITFEGLPDAMELGLVVSEPRHAAASWAGRPANLPSEIQLGTGALLRGRLLDHLGRPVVGARIVGEAWISEDGRALAQRRATSDSDGRWRLDALPAGSIGLVVSADRMATLRTTLDGQRDGPDLGDMVLSPAHALAVLTLDDLAAPVPGAEVRAGAAPAVLTDRRGRTAVPEADRERALELRVIAAGHLEGTLTVDPPLPPEAVVRLTRSLRLTGRFVGSDGGAVSDGEVRVTTGVSYASESLASDGSFELDVRPRVPVELLFGSSQTRELKVELEPGEPGELRELGDLRAPRGITVRGRLVRREDGEPIRSARVWAARRGGVAEVVAWAEGNLVESASNAEGEFVLAGLAAAPALLRIDAPGRSRHHVPVQPEPEQAEIDLGEVAIGAGATVWVRAPEAESAGALARVDLRGAWLELDMLSAPFADGVAAVRNVPPGEALVTVAAGREVVCEEPIEVDEGDSDVEVDCGRAERTVTGIVLVAGRPAGPGTLQWYREGVAPSEGIIFNQRRASGISQQQVFGAGRPSVEVAVGPDGHFATRHLSPGPWSVHWTTAEGATSRPRRVEIADLAGQALTLAFGGHSLRGVVVDEEDRPVELARVRDTHSDAFALSSADGSFLLGDLDPGVHQVFARRGDRTSGPVAVDVVPDAEPEPVVLRLGEGAEAEVRVWVRGPAGEPAAGALVFVDLGTELRTLTADAGGRVRVPLSYPLPTQVRAAGYWNGLWSLGEWIPRQRGGEELGLTFAMPGSLSLVTAEGRGLVQIRGPGDWHLTQLLLRIGVPPTVSPGQPLRLTGLPPGSYTAGLGSTTVTDTVRRGKETELELR